MSIIFRLIIIGYNLKYLFSILREVHPSKGEMKRGKKNTVNFPLNTYCDGLFIYSKNINIFHLYNRKIHVIAS